jgi:predicted kinase
MRIRGRMILPVNESMDQPLELIIFVGLQAAGKTTYFNRKLAATHVHVGGDLLKSGRNREMRQRQMIGDALASGRSVVVDNTNPTPAVRAPLIEIGRRFGARVIACYFEANVRDVIARNHAREGKARVPDVAIWVTKRKLVPPSFDEGFDEVRVIAAQPIP